MYGAQDENEASGSQNAQAPPPPTSLIVCYSKETIENILNKT
jgi:hypothetical protein